MEESKRMDFIIIGNTRRAMLHIASRDFGGRRAEKVGEAAKHDCGILSEGGRCFCKSCGVEKSDEFVVSSHISAHHKMGSNTQQDIGEDKTKDGKSNICQECGAAFKKPAYLKQHMQSHSLERPYICTVDGCQASYRRKDHLTRHQLQHQGNVFKCPIESCSIEFAYQHTLERHLKKFHENDAPPEAKCEKQFVCPEDGCGKVFRYGSQLQKHEDSHVKLDSVEAYCAEPGCMRPFTNKQCLRAHIQSCHQYMKCEICGSEELRKNIKRHLRKHESEGPQKTIQCSHEGCGKVFSTNSNLRQHMKVVHLEQKPFACSFSGCGMRFGYKHVRDNHERSGHHVYINGDFEVADGQFRSKPRGGRKRKCPTVEMLIRKRVTPPSELDFMLNEEC